jgi:signal transduction histidine kinase
MARLSAAPGSHRTLALLLLVVAVAPAATLVWLGLQLRQQDRVLLVQRERELAEAVAAAAANSLQRSLAGIERRLIEGPVPQGTVRLVFADQTLRADPPDRVAWIARFAVADAPSDEAFEQGERLEYAGHAVPALTAYRRLTHAADSGTRAGAWLRIARLHRAGRRWDEAIEAYGRLAEYGRLMVAGAPADLQARRSVCAVLDQAGRAADLAREAASLEADLLGGRWTLDQPAWELSTKDLGEWLGRPVEVSAERRMFSLVAMALAREDSTPPSSEVRLVEAEGKHVTVLTRSHGAARVSLAIAPEVVRAWVNDAVTSSSGATATVGLVDSAGALVLGGASFSGQDVIRLEGAETGLPWSVIVRPNASSRPAREFENRQRLLSAGLAAIVLLLAGGSYFAWRVMQRELAVARLQTDFVSAVSHEFRTPLTALKHVSELLEESDDVPRERRQALYEALGRNTERLQRLVESLLDFSRMESGKRRYDMQPVDAGALTRAVVTDFEREVSSRGFTVTLDVQPGPLEVSADPASLTSALWNLLDNAVKYSAEHRTVRVGVAGADGRVSITVEDAGIGIPAHEQQAVFGRFVRGEQAARLGIRGTGLGLALVSQIVRAHGGSIEVESVPGSGSTFRMTFPALDWSGVALMERHT